jgi:type I restriction enzyme, S subunit
MANKTWRKLSLGEVITLQRGYDLPHRDRKDGTIPIISSSGSIDTHNEARATGPGVVTGRYGTIGEVFFIAEDFWPLNTTLFVKDFKGNNPLFISFLLRTIDYQSYSGKSGVPGVNRNDLHEISVSLPPLSEQKAIATTLNDIDALITSLDRLIIKKRDIKQATMLQLLTGKTRLPGFSGKWEAKKIGDIFQFLGTANNSRSDLSEYGEIKYIHYGDIHTKWRSFLDCSCSELPFIQKDKVGNVPFLEDGDLVMADASEDYEGIGISIEVKNVTSKKVVAGLHTFLLRGNKEVLADGFKGYLQYMPAVKDALKKTATGISVYGISKNNVRNISIFLPDILEQQAIATVLSDMDAEIAALEHKREKTRMLKQGMMQELLTGKTRLL